MHADKTRTVVAKTLCVIIFSLLLVPGVSIAGNMAHATHDDSPQTNTADSPEYILTEQSNSVSRTAPSGDPDDTDDPDDRTRSGGGGGGGGGRGGGGGGGGGGSVATLDIYIRSVSWDCDAGTISVTAGPDSPDLSLSIRTTGYGLESATKSDQADSSGLATFTGRMLNNEDYIGLSLLLYEGDSFGVARESINVDSCTGSRTFEIPSSMAQNAERIQNTDADKTDGIDGTSDATKSDTASTDVMDTDTAQTGDAMDAELKSDPEPPMDIEPPIDPDSTNTQSDPVPAQTDDGGCLVATAAFGSELAPQVQMLREIRDRQLLDTESGTAFMTGFNQVYYSFSPAIADLERQNPAFREMVKAAITPMLASLSVMQHADSESEVLSYGIGVIMMNLGMYLGVPIFGILMARRYMSFRL